MALAVWDNVAEAVKDAINGHDFGITFTAVRSKEDVIANLESLGTLRVDVQHWECKYDRADSATMDYHCTTRVIVRKRFNDPSDRDETTGDLKNSVSDDYSLLLQKILEFFAPSQPGQGGRQLSGLPDAVWWDEPGTKPNRAGSFMADAATFVGWVDITHLVPVTIGSL